MQIKKIKSKSGWVQIDVEDYVECKNKASGGINYEKVRYVLPRLREEKERLNREIRGIREEGEKKEWYKEEGIKRMEKMERQRKRVEREIKRYEGEKRRAERWR